MKVKLNDLEIKICEMIAEARYNANRALNNPVGQISDSLSAMEIDLDGFGAELAFCKLVNVFPDFDCSPKDAFDRSYDVTLSNGQTVDVKTTRYKTGKLIVKETKKGYCDYFALMIGKFPDFEFRGMATYDAIVRPENLMRLTFKKQVYALQQKDLSLDILDKIKQF